MKIYCDYCGSQIETSENRTCPHCGAHYSADKELLDEKERVRRLNELEEERQRLEAERLRIENANMTNTQGTNKTKVQSGCLVVLLSLSILGIFFILMLICVVMEDAETKDKYNATKAAETTARISISYSMELKPIEMPKIPEIPQININDNIEQ